jgi:hypothetical protein
VKANVARAVVLTAVDAYGNRTTGYTGTVTFGGSGTVSANPYTFTTRDKGRHLFQVRFPAVGIGMTLTAADQNDPSIDGLVTGITVT